MTSQEKETNEYHAPWSRGYVLAQVNNLGDALAEIIKYNVKLMEEGEGFIIRADSMAGPSPYNLVIPVNAATDEKFYEIATNINNISAVNQVETAIVEVDKTYHPDPPHSAKGYVSDDDFQRDPTGPNPGPQDHNVWG